MKHGNNDGFSLVEVALALGIAAFALVAIFGLLPIGVTSNQNAVQQTVAAGIASSIAADLHNAPIYSTLTSGTSPVYGIALPAAGAASATHTLLLREDATPTAAIDNLTSFKGAVYRATVSLSPPAAAKRSATVVRVFISWPPSPSDSSATAFPANYSGYFETMTMLNRN